MRHGSRAARSPPGRRSGTKWPRRSQRPFSRRSSSPPQALPSVPRPTPSSASPSAPPDAVFGQHGGDVGVVVLHCQAPQTAVAPNSSAKRVL